MYLFVTVGTTKFDALVDIVTSISFFSILIDLGYTLLSIQTGTSVHNAPLKYKTLLINTFQYTQNLNNLIQESHTVISHAGSGTVLEVLKAKKKLLVCVNESLMDNHQTELACKLESLCTAQTCTIKSFMFIFKEMHTIDANYQPFDFNDGLMFSKHLNDLVLE